MKKLLILILIGLLLTLSIFVVVKGINVGNIQILGINGIQEKSKALDEKIQEASKLSEKDYQQAISTLEDSTKKLQQQKKKYEDMTQISEEGDIQNANQIERYEVETLWVKLGNHATSEGVILRIDILQGTSGAANTYNLKFTVTGSYISITDFISDIENDSTLGFKIEEFNMIPTSTDSNLQATFVCRDITIKDITSISNTETSTDEKNSTNSTNTNTTNTNGASGNNTNTTNSTNTSR